MGNLNLKFFLSDWHTLNLSRTSIFISALLLLILSSAESVLKMSSYTSNLKQTFISTLHVCGLHNNQYVKRFLEQFRWLITCVERGKMAFAENLSLRFIPSQKSQRKSPKLLPNLASLKHHTGIDLGKQISTSIFF